MKKDIEKRAYTIHGKERNFSKEEIEAILDKHIPKEVLVLPEIFEEAEKPTDGKCFKVELGKINFSLFFKEREDEKQEKTRKLILEAFIEAFKEPKKYELLYLLVPEKKMVYGDKNYANVEELVKFAEKVPEVGCYTATWVEVALGWAQQITNDNGSDEVWQIICNNPDTLKYYRLIIWKNNEIISVGGATEDYIIVPDPASYISDDDNIYYYKYNDNVSYLVPCVVLKSVQISLSGY